MIPLLSILMKMLQMQEFVIMLVVIVYGFNLIKPINQILVVYGCLNMNSFNYNSLANVDDSSCYDIVYGCMDSLAFNFNDWDFDGYP